MKKNLLNFFSLFTSVSTLLCCALPALVVALGFGATMAGFLSKYPDLIILSTYKHWIFIAGSILLILGGYLQYRARFEICPVDKDLARACTSARKTSFRVYIFSVTIFLVGFSFAYILPAIL